MSWMLPEEAFDFLAPRLPNIAGFIVELGSGEGTPRLLAMCPGRLFSVEHDPVYLGRHPTQYIHAPIVDGWYDAEVLKASLPNQIGAVIVDGPPSKIGRAGLLSWAHLFGSAAWLVDDVHREKEREMVKQLAKTWEVETHHVGDRAFATFGWGPL